MIPRDRGFLLLRSNLGDPNRRPLTMHQYRILAGRVQTMEQPEINRELTLDDLVGLGYDRTFARRILELLSQEEWLDAYLCAGKRHGCIPITCLDPLYPRLVRDRLGWDAPACYWAKGNTEILKTPAISLVGSRDLREDNRQFAEAVGAEAAKHGFTLVSGNARGADRAAQDACLAAGGKVISILPDELDKYSPKENQLLLSEDDFNAPFTKQRALSRNRSIHTMGMMVFVAQSDLHKGGTWDGTQKNLHGCWSTVVCYRDGSESSRELKDLGAFLLGIEDLGCIAELKQLL